MLDYQRLKEVRKTIFKENQTDFAKKIGLNYYKYSDIERGKVKMPADVLISLLLVYGINPYYLYGYGENPLIAKEIYDTLTANETKEIGVLNIITGDQSNHVIKNNSDNLDIENNDAVKTELFREIIKGKDTLISHLNERINDLKDFVKEIRKNSPKISA